MFQVTQTADPSFLAICGGVVSDLWSAGGGNPWLIAAGYVLGPLLLGVMAIWLMDRNANRQGRVYGVLGTLAARPRLGAVFRRIGDSWLWRRGDKALLAVTAAACVTMAAYIGWRALEIQEAAVAPLAAAPPATAADAQQPLPLIDHRGRPVDRDAFAGKPALVSFGYTFCPDVCPTTLSTMSQVLDALGPRSDAIAAAFVTIDPARDTADVLKAYLDHFHPGITGMTGGAPAIKALAQSYRVYYAKAGGDDAGKDYLMEHSAWIFLVGRDGAIIQRFPHTAAPEQIRERIRAEVAAPIS